MNGDRRVSGLYYIGLSFVRHPDRSWITDAEKLAKSVVDITRPLGSY
jgi:hypothetical protein